MKEDSNLELKEIKQIVELMKKYELSYFHLEKEDFRLKLKKGVDAEAVQELMSHAPLAGPPQVTVQGPPAASPAPPQPAPAAPSAPAEPAAAKEDGEPFESPMVGTFYRSSNPEDEPFVKVGQQVEEDTTLCIIEAMKVFNEIKAERRGVITKILVDNATPVQYGEPLFLIKPA